MIYIYMIIKIKQKLKEMSKFYNKYKKYFINQDSLPNITKSHLKPYLQQKKIRPQSFNRINQLPFKYQQSKNNQFQTNIIPKLNQLNVEIEKHKINIIKKPFQYVQHDYQYQNKNNRMEIRKKSNHYHGNNIQRLYNAFGYSTDRNKIPKTYNTIDYIYNPQKSYQLPLLQDIKQLNWSPKYQQKLNLFTNNQPKKSINYPLQNYQNISPSHSNITQKYHTEASSPINHKIKLSKINNIRKDYGYPQINYKLIQDQYQKNNQFKLITKKLNDIKLLQKYQINFPPHNLYALALLRRNQGKKNISTRRSRLISLLQYDDFMLNKSAPLP